MRAVVLHALGEPEELVLEEVPAPRPAEGQVLVDVKASALNFVEVLVRRGLYAQMPDLPWIPGVEISGTTVEGRRVLGLIGTSGGGYAEQAVLDEGMLFDLPEGASFEQGAAFLLAYLTAWIPLTRQASIHPGARVLVHAAAGGVGSAAVVVARDLGAEVVATASSEEKLRLPSALGASEAVTYDRLGEIEPVDVVFDPVGGQLLADSIGLLRPLGVALAIGFAGGAWPQLDPALLVGRNVGVQGFYLGRLMRRRPDLVREAGLDLLRLWRAGQVRPIVGAVYPFADVAEAHRLMESRRSTGKVVLVP
jgi:NADPH2:quinone reductase